MTVAVGFLAVLGGGAFARAREIDPAAIETRMLNPGLRGLGVSAAFE